MIIIMIFLIRLYYTVEGQLICAVHMVQSLTTIVIVTLSISLIFATILVSTSGWVKFLGSLYSGHLSKVDNKFGPESVRFRESSLY